MFEENNLVLLIDKKERKYLISLKRGGKFSSHLGIIEHDKIIGKEEGSIVNSNKGGRYLVLKPTLKDFVTKMPRGAQVIYPKDIGSIIIWADIFPGAKVIEAGTGSGALTLYLLRAIGTSGLLISYEQREDFLNKASKNIYAFVSQPSNLVLKCKDIYSGIDEDNIDRIVLDLPEPWRVIPHAINALKDGGIIISLIPTVLQVMTFVDSLRNSKKFYPIEIFETMLRHWNIKGQSVRPEHFMVSHTAFLVSARKISSDASLFDSSLEHWKTDYIS